MALISQNYHTKLTFDILGGKQLNQTKVFDDHGGKLG